MTVTEMLEKGAVALGYAMDTEPGSAEAQNRDTIRCVMLASIAISTKRIADHMDKLAAADLGAELSKLGRAFGEGVTG